MKTKLAMFDMDGTLYDTRMAHYLAYREVLEREGTELDYEYFAEKCFGGHYRAFLSDLTDDVERVHDEKLKCYKKYIGRVVENKRLYDLMEALRRDHYLALVTTASEKSVREILECFGRQDFFDLVVTQEQVKKKKPDPEAYLYTMEHFGIAPENCIVFEDSEIGIEAAVRSGAKLCKVTDFN